MTRPVDPAVLAARIVEAVTAEALPARLLFGDDAVTAVTAKLDRLRADVERSRRSA